MKNRITKYLLAATAFGLILAATQSDLPLLWAVIKTSPPETLFNIFIAIAGLSLAAYTAYSDYKNKTETEIEEIAQDLEKKFKSQMDQMVQSHNNSEWRLYTRIDTMEVRIAYIENLLNEALRLIRTHEGLIGHPKLTEEFGKIWKDVAELKILFHLQRSLKEEKENAVDQ